MMYFRCRLHSEFSRVFTPPARVHLTTRARRLLLHAQVLSNTIKQKRKEKAGKWAVPLPKVKPVTDEEMFRSVTTGKKRDKSWKRMVTKVTFVGNNFTR